MSTRDISQQTLSLFEPSVLPGPTDVFEATSDEKSTNKVAKDFVRWCFSFGTDFHNSPDVTNLRFWAQKTKAKIRESEQSDILSIARQLFFKRIEQLTRKAEAAAN
jgi:hypothetical protein